MATAAPEIIHVNGPATISLGPGNKTPSQLTRLGITEDGVTIEPILYRRELFTDFVGSGIPADYLELGKTCIVTATLVSWNAQILETFRGGMRGRSAGAVSSSDIGRMLLASGRYFELFVDSSRRTGGVKESPYRFQTFLPWGSSPVRVSSRFGTARIQGIAHPYRGFCYVRR